MNDNFIGFNESGWKNFKKDLKKIVGDTAYNNWLKQLNFLSLEDDTLALSVPTKFLRDWIVNHYADKIKLHCKKYNMKVETLKIAVKPVGGRIVPGTARIVKNEKQKWGNFDIRNNQPNSSSDDFGAPLDPRFTFDNFVVGKPNELAFAASQRVAESEKVTFNPLFLYGGVGLGKTHLIQAVGHEIKSRARNARLSYVSSERFTNEVVNAIRYDRTLALREKYRNIDVLLVDDIQFISGKQATQQEFFHTFNTLYDAQKQLVVSSDSLPKEIPDIQERLQSRFEWGLIADIQPPDLETKVAILKKKAAFENFELPDDVAFFIASKIESNVRQLEGSLVRLMAFSSLTDEPVSLAMAQKALRAILKSEEKHVNIEKIQKTVADYFKLKVSTLKAKNNSKAIAIPRQIGMYLCRELTKASLPEIGRSFGGKHHTTVIYSIKKVQHQKSSNKDYAKLIKMFFDSLK